MLSMQVKDNSHMAICTESFDASFSVLIKQVLCAWWNPELRGNESGKSMYGIKTPWMILSSR